MKGRAIGFIEPVTGIERQQLNLGAIRQCGGLVEHEPASVHPSFDRHPGSLAPEVPPNKRLHLTAAAV